MKWALNESKALMSGNKEHDDSEDEDPELARVLEESKALYEQYNNDNNSRTPSPDPSPSLLGGGAGYTDHNSNNNTGDSGYCGSSVDLTLDDELQHRVGGAKFDHITFIIYCFTGTLGQQKYTKYYPPEEEC